MVLELRAVRINYLKSWFFVDLLSCLPYDIFNALQQANSAEVASFASGPTPVRPLMSAFHDADILADILARIVA